MSKFQFMPGKFQFILPRRGMPKIQYLQSSFKCWCCIYFKTNKWQTHAYSVTCVHNQDITTSMLAPLNCCRNMRAVTFCQTVAKNTILKKNIKRFFKIKIYRNLRFTKVIQLSCLQEMVINYDAPRLLLLLMIFSNVRAISNICHVTNCLDKWYAVRTLII